MFKLEIQTKAESWDSINQEFIAPESITVELEHSLVSLSKWEELWEKPFLSSEDKSLDETLSYIHLMCLSPDISLELLQHITNDQLLEINNYINAKKSATWFNEKPGQGQPLIRREVITSELLYYWIFSHRIDMACETWHLNRLFTLLKVFNEKNAPPKKMKKTDVAAQNRLLNQQRQAQLKTTG